MCSARSFWWRTHDCVPSYSVICMGCKPLRLSQAVLIGGQMSTTCAVRQGDFLCRALERALPNAPPRRYQTVQDPAILHTTLARLVQLQGRSTGRILRSGGLDQAAEIQSAAGRMTQALCGLALTLRSLW